jgi:hypothetical protein
MSLGDYDALINPKPEAPLWVQRVVDGLSWAFPAIAAPCSVGGGIMALRNENAWAAALGIAGGVISALGVGFTNWASRIRDNRLAQVRSLGALGMDIANTALNRMPPDF